jgi:hypothetical protein
MGAGVSLNCFRLLNYSCEQFDDLECHPFEMEYSRFAVEANFIKRVSCFFLKTGASTLGLTLSHSTNLFFVMGFLLNFCPSWLGLQV